MNKEKKKKILLYICYMFLPCIMIGIGFHKGINFNVVYLLTVYSITIGGIILFFVRKMYRFKLLIAALLLGFVISPLYPFIIGLRAYNLEVYFLGFGRADLHFFTTTVTLALYGIPFFIISGLIVLVKLVNEKKKALLNKDNENTDSDKKGSNKNKSKKKRNKKKGKR